MPEVNVKPYVRNGKLVRAYRRTGRAGRGQAIQAPAGGPQRLPRPLPKQTGTAGGAVTAPADVTASVRRLVRQSPGSYDFQRTPGSAVGKWVDRKTGKVLGYSTEEDARVFTSPAAAQAWARKQRKG